MEVCVYVSQYFCNCLPDLLPLEHRNKSPPTRNHPKPSNQHFLPRAKTKRKKEYYSKAWKKDTSSRQVRKKKKEKTEKYSTSERTR